MHPSVGISIGNSNEIAAIVIMRNSLVAGVYVLFCGLGSERGSDQVVRQLAPLQTPWPACWRTDWPRSRFDDHDREPPGGVIGTKRHRGHRIKPLLIAGTGFVINPHLRKTNYDPLTSSSRFASS